MPPPVTWDDIAPRPSVYQAISADICELYTLAEARGIREIMISHDDREGGKRYALIHDELRAALASAPSNIGAVLTLPESDYEEKDIDLRASTGPSYDFVWDEDEDDGERHYCAELRLFIARGSTIVTIVTKTVVDLDIEWTTSLKTDSFGLFPEVVDADEWSLFTNGTGYADGEYSSTTKLDQAFSDVLARVRAVIEFSRAMLLSGNIFPRIGSVDVLGSPVTKRLLRQHL